MFGFIRNFFPRRVESIEDFVEVVRREGCRAVVVEPHIDSFPDGPSVYGQSKVLFWLTFATRNPDGRRVIYLELLFEHVGVMGNHRFSRITEGSAIKALLIGEQRVMKLRTKLPNVSVDIIGPTDHVMDETKYAELHNEAKALGVSV